MSRSSEWNVLPLRTPSALCCAGWRSSASSDADGRCRRVSRRSPLVSRGHRPTAERSLAALRSRGTTIHHAAPGCLGLRVHRVFGYSGCRDDRQLHSPRWADRGSPGGWRFLGAKLFGSNNDVSLSDAATGRDTRSTGLSGRCVLFRSVTGRHPGGIRFGVAFASRPTALRGRDPGTAIVDHPPSGDQPAGSLRSATLVTALRSTYNEVCRSRGLVPQVLPRPGECPGRHPSGKSPRDSRECPTLGAEPLIVVLLGTAASGPFLEVTLAIP